MKKALFMCLVAFGLVFYSCNNTNQTSKNESVNKEDIEPNYPPELVEMANQYHFNIDTTKTYDLDIKVFQSLGDYECLAHENTDRRYKWYNGQLLYYWSSDMVYDEKIIKEKAYLLGTYHYVSRDSTHRVVPFYCNIEAYKKNMFRMLGKPGAL